MTVRPPNAPQPAQAGRTTCAVPRRFYLDRSTDVSHVSGTGDVAWGTWYPNGLVNLCWKGDALSTTTFVRFDDLVRVHGHNGATQVVWIDPPGPDIANTNATSTSEARLADT